jgi:hypothetical protein
MTIAAKDLDFQLLRDHFSVESTPNQDTVDIDTKYASEITSDIDEKESNDVIYVATYVPLH